jgi:large subunit ribosomal protein L5
MRLQEIYKKEITKKLKEKFGYKNVMQIPKLEKVVLNVGFGRSAKEKSYVDAVKKTLTLISGQKPIMTKAKKSISSFKIREGMVIGASVTMRGKRMFDFVEKLVNITYPRVRDFHGISDKCVDQKGNMTVGFKEHTVFPEIKVEDVENTHGLEICLATSAKTREEGVELFSLLGFPFKKEDKK